MANQASFKQAVATGLLCRPKGGPFRVGLFEGFGCGLLSQSWKLENWTMKKRAPGCLGFFGDEILPSYVRIIIYKPLESIEQNPY